MTPPPSTPGVTCTRCQERSPHPGPLGEFVTYWCERCGVMARDVVHVRTSGRIPQRPSGPAAPERPGPGQPTGG